MTGRDILVGSADDGFWHSSRFDLVGHLKIDCVQVLQLCRQLSGKDRERSHLLCLYGTLCSCINSKEHRVRELVQDVLQLAGVELGLVAEPTLNSQVAS